MNGTVIGETLRRHLTNVAYGGYVALTAIIALGVSRFDRPGAAWPSMVGLLAIITGCGPIGPEFSSGTLQLILVKPLTRASYLLSRVTGVVLAVWLAASVACVCELGGRLLWSDVIAWRTVLTSLVNCAVDTILTVSLLTLLGSLTRAYLNVAIYFVVMIGFAMSKGMLAMLRSSATAIGQFLSDNPIVERALDVVDQNLFPDLPLSFDSRWILRVSVNAATALILACLAFRRREVPYGAD